MGRNAGITIGDIGDVAIPEIQGFLDDLGGGDLGGLLPDVDPQALPDDLGTLQDQLGGLLPEGTDPQELQNELEQLLP